MSKTPLTDDFAEHDFVMEAIRLHPMILERIKAWADFARKLETDRAELIEALQTVIAIMCDKEICGHFLPREIREVAEPLLARLEAE